MKDSDDIKSVFLRWYGTPALDMALADLKPLILSWMRAVAGCSSLKRGEFSGREGIRFLLLADVVKKGNVHIWVVIAVL